MLMTLFIRQVAQFLGVSEPAIRLLLAILAGYPLAWIFHKFITDKSPLVHHLYFTLSGLVLCYFNYGLQTLHSVTAILFTYIWIHLTHTTSRKILIAGNFIFHMAYLLTGYYFTESNTYDIKWTMPHCVLVLRLIGFAFDIGDGKLSNNDNIQLSKDQKENMLTRIPSLLELFAFTYFPSSFLVGPQFPFRRYEKFVNKEFTKYKSYIKNGIIRGCLGVLYLCIYQIGSNIISNEYLISDEFDNSCIFKKLFYLGLWGKLTLYKYIACWLLTEGALTCFGLTFSGITEDGQEDWSGCTNARIKNVELASKLADFVHAFNINTNTWLANYVYKRLKFLGNRMISQAAALLFLAVWHGFHSGYYVSFFFEFAFITCERQIASIYKEIASGYEKITDSIYFQIFIYLACKIYVFIFLGWCLLPFVYFNYERWSRVLSIFNYAGVVFLISWLIIRQVYLMYLRPTRKINNEKTN